ncbi:glycosyltransferase [Curtobacterium sp. Leaf261]|uniref:glycosyltransferase n=1 Tax=Curtobacterium sp. Leaf261 TaxID=1736311 RepID=UPI0006FC98EA|nr:glycosyltransferase [Curtobacterium sp. Leaf261]KQO65301.1 glucosyl transferase [Curtobacterium sp. Leaf261]
MDGSARKNERLRILLAADTFPPDVNGAANFCERLAVGLVERGHDVHIVAPATGLRKNGTFVEQHGTVTLTVHRLFSLRWPGHWLRFAWPWTARRNTAKILDAFHPDVVHLQSHIVIGRGLARTAIERGIPVIATNHFMPENVLDQAPLPQWIIPLAIRIAWRDAAKTYRLVDRITAPTRRAAEYLEAAVDVHDVLAVSCGIQAGLYTSRDLRPADNHIVFVGRIAAEKQIEVLLRAMTLLDPALRTTLTVVGGGDHMPVIEKLVSELGLGDRVTLTGFSSDEVLRAALTNGTVFAMPSTAELQSIASLEAMASGLPIVAANSMALPHLVDGNGYLFEPGDERDLAEKLTAVLTADDDEYLRMKHRSLEMIAPHDIDRTLSTFEALYRGEPVAAGPEAGR